jgi:hypothetical protein
MSTAIVQHTAEIECVRVERIFSQSLSFHARFSQANVLNYGTTPYSGFIVSFTVDDDPPVSR